MSYAFKVGDRVRFIGKLGPGWRFLLGATGVVYIIKPMVYIHWDDHADDEPTPDCRYAWYTGGWNMPDFEPAEQTPFDAAVRAYIKSELAP